MTSGEGVTLQVDPAAVQWRLVDDEVLVLDLRNSRYLAINQTGARLWPLLVRGSTGPELCDELVRVWAVDRDSAERDVADFVTQLGRDGLLMAFEG